MDLITFLGDILTAILKHGFSVTTLVVAITALLRVQGIRKRLIKRLPKRFRHEQISMNELGMKIDALSKALGVVSWDAVEIQTTSSTVKRGLILSQEARYIARHVRQSIMRRDIQMKSKLLSRKFILAVVTGILIILNDGLDLGIDSNTVLNFSALIATYILGEAATDIAKVKAVSEVVKTADPATTRDVSGMGE